MKPSLSTPRRFSRNICFLAGLATAWIVLSTSPSLAVTVIHSEPNLFDNRVVLSPETLSDVVGEALIKRGINPDHRIEFTGEPNRKGLILDNLHGNLEADVTSLEVSDRTGLFKATLMIRAGDQVEERELRGRFSELVEVPVLVHRLEKEQLIAMEDLEFVQVEKRDLAGDTVMDAEELLGKTLRNGFPAARPMRLRDVIRETLVERNQAINVIYSTPYMQLKTMAVALEDGAKGDVIRIKNPDSNKIIRAIVKDERLVTVLAPSRARL